MRINHLLLAIFGMICVTSAATRVATAAEPASGPKTLMVEPGKELFSDSFTKDLPADWKALKGTWEVSGGALKGVEKTEDMHPAVLRHDLKAKDFVAHFSFRLDGSKSTAFSINGKGGHIGRVTITPVGFTARKDQPNKTSTEKGVNLDTVAQKFAAGEWYTMTVEWSGKNLVAWTDATHVAIGSDDALAVEKNNVSLTTAGAGVCFKDLSIAEAGALKSDWEQVKGKLLAARQKSADAK